MSQAEKRPKPLQQSDDAVNQSADCSGQRKVTQLERCGSKWSHSQLLAMEMQKMVTVLNHTVWWKWGFSSFWTSFSDPKISCEIEEHYFSSE